MSDEEFKQRVAVILGAYSAIERAWEKNGRLDYTVTASTPISGKSLEEIKGVRFWAGYGAEGADMSLDELVGMFLLLRDQHNALKEVADRIELGLPPPKGFQIKTKIDLAPIDSLIAEVLPQIRITE